MKRYRNALLALTMCAGAMSGCKADPQPNEDRGTDYKYDIVDYLEFNAFGEDGNGYLEITLKDFSASDFPSESDYIAVRKDIDSLNPYYVTNGSRSGIDVDTPEDMLSNGDIVTIEFDIDDDEKLSDLNTEAYEYTVEGLSEELPSLNLFGEDFVTIYGDENNQIHLSVVNSYYDFASKLDYSYSSNVSELTVGQTVVDMEVSLDRDFCNENGYSDLDEFLAKEYGLKTEGTTGSTVLNKMASVIDFGTVSSTDLYNELTSFISTKSDYSGDENINAILNIQRTEREMASAPYECVVVYSTFDGTSTQYFYKTVEIGYVDNKITIMNEGSTNSVWNEETAREPLSNTNTIVLTY